MDPMTIAVVVASLSKVLGGITGFLGNRAKAKQLEYAAQQARQEGAVRANIALRKGDEQAAEAAVKGAGGAGGGLVGSTMDVLDQMASDSMFNARVAIYEGESEAKQLRYQASVAKTEGAMQLIQGAASGATSWLSGSADMSAQAGSRAASASRAPSSPSSLSVEGLY